MGRATSPASPEETATKLIWKAEYQLKRKDHSGLRELCVKRLEASSGGFRLLRKAGARSVEMDEAAEISRSLLAMLGGSC